MSNAEIKVASNATQNNVGKVKKFKIIDDILTRSQMRLFILREINEHNDFKSVVTYKAKPSAYCGNKNKQIGKGDIVVAHVANINQQYLIVYKFYDENKVFNFESRSQSQSQPRHFSTVEEELAKVRAATVQPIVQATSVQPIETKATPVKEVKPEVDHKPEVEVKTTTTLFAIEQRLGEEKAKLKKTQAPQVYRKKKIVEKTEVTEEPKKVVAITKMAIYTDEELRQIEEEERRLPESIPMHQEEASDANYQDMAIQYDKLSNLYRKVEKIIHPCRGFDDEERPHKDTRKHNSRDKKWQQILADNGGEGEW